MRMPLVVITGGHMLVNTIINRHPADAFFAPIISIITYCEVVINLQDKYSAIVIPKDAVTAYERYIGKEAEITLDEYLEILERDGEIVLESEKTGRKVTITRVGRSE